MSVKIAQDNHSKSKGRFRFILWPLLMLFLFYLFWLGYSLLRFKKYSGQELEKEKRPSVEAVEIRGVYHLHTKFSDGRIEPAKLAKLAAISGLDFIIITDHGNPNLASMASEGWKNGLLLLAGSELSTSRGHLVGLDFKAPQRSFSQNAELALREIASQGGFSVIAHPFSKTRWSWGKQADYTGIEIIDADTMMKKNFVSSIPYLPALLIKPSYFLLKLLDRPEQPIRKWDELNAIQPLFGYFSADAHILYRPLLSLFRLHLLLDKPLSPEFETAKAQVYGALRRGQFFSAIDAAAEPRGFLFWAEKDQERFPMGSEIALQVPSNSSALQAAITLRVRMSFPFAKEARFIYNGKTVFRSKNDEFSFIPLQPGFFRVEVYLRERTALSPDIPWIVTNPIFLRKEN